MTWNPSITAGRPSATWCDTADDRRDGVLPMDVPGVAENFTDELDLVGALLLKWHARLSGNIERALMASRWTSSPRSPRPGARPPSRCPACG